jgi:uncharacterized delta-60 repeat protein
MFLRRPVAVQLAAFAAVMLKLPAAPGNLDISFQSSRGASNVQTIVEQPDGKVIIGGDFTAVDDIPRNRIARLNPDGSLDRRFLSGLSGANGQVRAALLQSDGRILIAGAFTMVNGLPRGRIARLHGDGTLDTGFLNGLAGVGNQAVSLGVYSIALQSDGKVLVGGSFGVINGVPRGGVARLNADGSLDPGFMDGLAGADSTVRAVVSQPDGKVLIGGYFGTVNGVTRKGIARLNSDGTLDGEFQGNLTGIGYQIKAVAVQTDGEVVIGGSNISIGGAARGGIARLHADGTEDAGFRSGAPAYGTDVHALALQPTGEIVAGGHILNRPEGKLDRLHADGAVDVGFPAGYSYNVVGAVTAASVVHCILWRSDGTMLIGGDFTEIGNGIVAGRNPPCNGIVRLLSNGRVDTSLVTAQTGADSMVAAVAVQADGNVLTGGGFGEFNGAERRSLVRLKSDGTPDAGFPADPVGSLSSVRTIALQADGKVLLGGDFSTVLGQSHYRVARLNSDATLDSTFLDRLPAGTPTVDNMATQADGKILVAANDSKSAPKPFSLTRLNSDGTVDPSFVNGLDGAALQLWHIATLPGGKVLAGGEAKAGEVSPSRLLWRLNNDGSHDAGFAANLSGSSVRTMALQSDGKILIGGGFSGAGGSAQGGVARLNTDGSVDTGFMNGLSGANRIVHCLALQSDGKVLIGGEFTMVNGVSRNRIARLNPNGTLDAEFLNGQAGVTQSSVPFPAVYTIAVQSDGRILIGGLFSNVNGVKRGSIARLHGDAPDIAVEQLSGTSIVHDSSTAVQFAPVPAGESATLTVTLRNNGNQDLTGLNVTKVSGNGTADFTVGAPEATTLTPNAVTTFAVSFSPQAPGTRTALLEIASNDPDESPFLLRVTGRQATSLDLWRREHFGSFDNSGTGGDISDPDGDGAGNLVEFATGTDPSIPSPPAWQLLSGGGAPEFSYSRPRAGTESLRYQVEWSNDTRGTWITSGPGSVVSDDGTVQQFRARVPVGSPASERWFARLRVTPFN